MKRIYYWFSVHKIQALSTNYVRSARIMTTPEDIDRIGNTLIYLRNEIGFLSKSKALKLLYLIEETSVKKYGRQILNLDFKVWQHGPVSKEIYYELNSDVPELLADYISLVPWGNGNIKIEAVADFNDDEFSEIDLRLIDEVIETFGHLDSGQLSDITHQKGRPWELGERKIGGRKYWKTNNYSEEDVDLASLIQEDKGKLSFYKTEKEFQEFSRTLKN